MAGKAGADSVKEKSVVLDNLGQPTTPHIEPVDVVVVFATFVKYHIVWR